MSFVDRANEDGRAWLRVGDCYGVTRKPRDLNVRSQPAVPFIPMESVPQGGNYEPSYVLKQSDALTSGAYFERGDVLVAKITPSFENGKQALVRSLPLPFGYATTEVIPLHPLDAKHDPRLLFFYLLHPDIRHYVAERMEGSTGRQRVPERVLLDLPMPDIEPEDQMRIADSLELVHAAIAVEEDAANSARELKQAAMHELFTRGLRGEAQKETDIGLVPESWAIVTVGNVARLSTGTTPATKDTRYYGGTIPFIKTADVVNNRITSALMFVSELALNDYNLTVYPAGTVLMAMYGQGKTRGQVALLEIAAATTQNAAAIQPSNDIDSAFLWHYLMSCYERLRGMGSLGHVSHLNLGYLRDLQILRPPLEEQREIVAVLDAIDRKIALHRRKRDVLDELFKSLLHKLMTGEIRVDQLDLSALRTPADSEGVPA